VRQHLYACFEFEPKSLFFKGTCASSSVSANAAAALKEELCLLCVAERAGKAMAFTAMGIEDGL